MDAPHRVGAWLLLLTAAVALAFAPLLMPFEYSWIRHTTSESAAQGIRGAWLARSGFVCFGAAVAMIAWIRRREWGWLVVLLQMTFAVCMVAAAVFSTQSFRPGDAVDATESVRHSIAATVMGFAFTFALVVRLISSARKGQTLSWLTFATAATATLIPLAMMTWPSAAGVLQRSMFAAAFIWFGREL